MGFEVFWGGNRVQGFGFQGFVSVTGVRPWHAEVSVEISRFNLRSQDQRL